MENVNYETNPTKLNLHPKVWKRVFELFRAFDRKNEQDNTVKSIANYGVPSRFHRVLA